MIVTATTLRFVLLGDDRASQAFDKFTRSVDRANGAVGRNNKTMRAGAKDSDTLGMSMGRLVGHLAGADAAFTLVSKKSNYFQKGLAAVNLATGLAEPLVSSLVVATGGLAAAFTAAGAGLGAYGLALAPFLQTQKKATQLQAQAMAGNKAAKKSLDELLKEQPKAFRQFYEEVGNATTAYKTWSMQLAEPVLRPLILGLSFVHRTLYALNPLVRAAGDAFGQLVGELGQKIQGGGVERIVSVLLPHVRPVLLDLGHSIANIVAGFWGIIRAFLPFSETVTGGLEKLTEKFKTWATTLSGHSGFHAVVQQWRDDWPVIRPVLDKFLIVLKNILSAMAGMSTPSNSRLLWNIANPLLTLAEALSSHPALVQFFFYLYMISKGAGQLKGVFGLLKGTWTVVATAIAKLTGGKITLGSQMLSAAGTMETAARQMQIAADTMAGAGTAAGKAAGGLGAAEAAGAGAAAGAAARGGLLSRVFGGLRFLIRGGLAIGTVILATRIAVSLVPKQGGAVPKGPGWAKTIAETLFGKGIDNVATWFDKNVGAPIRRTLGSVFTPGGKANMAARDWFGNLGKAAQGATGPIIKSGQAMQGTGGMAQRAAAQQAELNGQTVRMTGAMKSAAPPVDDLRGKSQALAQQFMHGLGRQLDRLHANTPTVRTDINNLATSIKNTGDKSKATQSDRQKLIHDLEQSGVKASTAKGLVNHLSTAIVDIPNKHSTYLKFGVNVPQGVLAHYPSAADMRAAGFATGGRIRGPGTGTSDTAGLFPLSNNEWVIRANSATQYGNKAMDAVNQGTATIVHPGMASGGVVEDLTARTARTAPPGAQRIGYQPTDAFALKLWQVWIDRHSGGFKAVREAMKWIGEVPYVWGGMAVPGGADCSGFVSYVYNKALGIMPPRTSEAQYGWVKRTSPQPGGLAFYTNPQGGTPPGHVALVKDSGTVISQGGPGKGPIVIGLHGPGPLMGTGIPPGGFAARGNFSGVGGQFGENQLAQLWMQAGGARNLSHLMAAIAMAESGGNANARNPSGASGLWQILGLPFPGNPFDPLTNARMARAKYLTQGLSAWEAYTNGSYRRFMAEGGRISEPIAGVGMSGRSYMFGEAGPEYVSSQSDMTDVARLLSLVLRELRSIRGHTASAPERTGAATASALNGGSRRVALGRG